MPLPYQLLATTVAPARVRMVAPERVRISLLLVVAGVETVLSFSIERTSGLTMDLTMGRSMNALKVCAGDALSHLAQLV
jgi:hypothetical protein